MFGSRLLQGTLFCVLLAATSSVAFGQFVDVPRPSQHAQVTQRIGITDITVNYHRPLVNNPRFGEGWFHTATCGAPELMRTQPFRSATQ